jgi:uncharacterized membrane protein
MTFRERLKTLWVERGAYLLALIYLVVMFALLVSKHNAFNTRVYDFARFSQAIWNTLDGKFLFESIRYRSILGDHFSPLMALAAPFLLIWPDERVLFFIQALNVAVAGLLLYKIIHDKRPELAPWFLLVFFLNPALHEVTLFEVRRIVFALPFLALALYALYKHNRWLMLLGLFMALLAKEDISFIVFMIGFYLLIFERDWKWGIALMILGAVWMVVISLWIIPLFNPSTAGEYPQLYYFSYLGNSLEEITQNLLADPLILLRRMFGQEQLIALWRILLPLGLILPFLEPRWVLFTVPYVFILLISSDEDMYRIVKWYPGTILVVLFAAMAVGWDRIPKRWERWAMAGLLAMTVVGYFLYSPAPFGGRYEASLYQVSDHDRLALEVLDSVPPDARVAAQPLYVPHLTFLADLYHFPWIKIGHENIDFFLLDRHTEPYPYNQREINDEITNMVADTSYVVVEEADGIYLFQNHGQQLPAYPVDRVAEGSIRLDRIEVALLDDDGRFQNTTASPIPVKAGQEIRVTLYWEALAAPEAERTVSVRIANDDGWLYAQKDSMPVGGTRPTSWWQPGQTIRDVYYLTVPPDTPPGSHNLDLVLYDTYTLDIVPFTGEGEILHLQPIVVEG